MGKGIEKDLDCSWGMELKELPLLFIKQLYHPIGKSDFGNMNLRRVGVSHAHEVYAGGLLDHICTVGIKTKIHHHLLGAHRLKGFVLFFDKVMDRGSPALFPESLNRELIVPPEPNTDICS